MQNVLLMIISFMLYAAFDQIKMYDLAAQFMLIGFWRGLLEPALHPRVQEEIALIEYPKERYRKKRRYYLGAGIKEKKEPAEFVWMERVLTVLFIIFTVILWIRREGSSAFGNSIAGFYGIVGVFIVIETLNHIYKVAFYKKYKRLTKYNWRYRLGLGRFGQQPQKNKIGKCKIIKEQKNGRKKYYIVEEKKSGNVHENVMYCGEGSCDLKREYSLYEICKVKYII